jgi:uncharacterized protein
MDIIEQIKQEAKYFFEEAGACHGWDHIERVYNLALHIGEKENADLEILKLAALLHDIARIEQDNSNGEICHAELGASLAKEILKKHNFSEEKINKVVHCIRTHRFRKENKPETKEAQILYDADKIDSIGAIGIGRVFAYGGEHDRSLDKSCQEFQFKLSKVKDNLLTEEGKKVAQERHDFMVKFFERFFKEADGEL